MNKKIDNWNKKLMSKNWKPTKYNQKTSKLDSMKKKQQYKWFINQWIDINENTFSTAKKLNECFRNC